MTQCMGWRRMSRCRTTWGDTTWGDTTWRQWILVAALLTYAASNAVAADRIRVVAQRTGTFAWELEVLKQHGLDKQADLDIETTELASTEAGKVALQAGSADLMLSDWLWVAR